MMASVGKRVTRKPAKRKGRDGNNNPFDGVDNLAEGLWLAIITFAGIPAVGALSWYAFSGWWRVFAVTLAAAAGSGLAAWVWLEAAPRSIYLRIRVTASTALAGWSIAVHTILSPILWWRIWVPISAVVVAWWCIPKTPAVRGYGQDTHGARDTLAEELGIGGTHARTVQVSEDGVRRRLELRHPGLTTAEVQKVSETMASKANLPRGAIRVTPNPESAQRSWADIVREDVLRKAIPWPGPSAPGESCAIPARIGLREDAHMLEIVRPGDASTERSAMSVAVQGETGSGKTRGVLCEIAEQVTRSDIVLMYADVRKSGQTLPLFRPAVDWTATSMAQVRAMVSALPRAIEARAALLGKTLGLEQWEPGCGIPFVHWWFAEAPGVMEMLGGGLKNAAETIRSVGFSLTVEMQRFSSMSLGDEGTDLRAQLGIGWCFRIKNDDDLEMVLRDETIAAGISASSFPGPGYCYLEASHVAPSDWSIRARTYDLRPDALRPHIATWAPRMARLDETTAAALGSAYANRETVSVSDWMAELDARGLGIGSPRGRRVLDVAPRPALETETETGDEDELETLDETETRDEVRAELDAIEDELGGDDGDDGDEPMDIEELRADLGRDDAAALAGVPETEIAALDLSESTYTQRLGVYLAWVESLRLPAEVSTGAGVDWFIDRRLDPSRGRPAWTRITRRLVREGGAEDRGYGRWMLLPGAPGLLRDWIAAGDGVTGRDGDDEDADQVPA